MTVLRSLLSRANLESTTVPLSDASLVDFLSGPRSDSGVAVSERRTLGLPAYYRALAVTAGTIASLPLKVYNQEDRSKATRRTVLDNPNPRQTPIEWKMTTLMNAIGWGDAFSRKIRDGSGRVVQVWPIHPSRVRITEVAPTGANPEGKVFHIADAVNGGVKDYTSVDILHLPYLSPTGVCGVRPLEVFRQSLGIAIAGEDSTARFLKNGSRLSGIITTDKDLDESVSKRLRSRWRELTAGVENSGEIGILDNGASWTAVAVPPADAQWLEGRKWAVSEIARMVGTPPHLIGDITNSTSWGTGIEEQVLGWVKFTLQTWITSIEQRFTEELLLPGEYCEASLEGLLRGDSKTRAAFYHYAITDGWLNRNEVRLLENRERADGLDEYMTPLNMSTGDAGGVDPAEIAALIQKIYLGVGTVVTVEEARKIIEAAGADLDTLTAEQLAAMTNPGALPGL